MNVGSSRVSLALFAVLACSSGCASSPTAPFNQVPNSQVTAFRLQNYEPPQQQAPATTGIAGVPNLLPPEIQTWVNQGAAGLRQLIPPGLLPQGMSLPGMTPTAPSSANEPRFHNFRILSQTPVMDADTRQKIANVLGDESNFDVATTNCMYAEMGISFSPTFGGPPDDVLISFSCRNVAAFGFGWPYGNKTALKPATEQKLAEIVQKLWPS